jgi:plasmid stability protein
MAALLIRDLPATIHRQLKREAKRSRRSVSREAVVLMEEALSRRAPIEFPAPVKVGFPLTKEWIRNAIREGRA